MPIDMTLEAIPYTPSRGNWVVQGFAVEEDNQFLDLQERR